MGRLLDRSYGGRQSYFFPNTLATRQHDRWLPRHRRFGCPLAACWLMRHRPTGDCWQEPTNSLWLPRFYYKKLNIYNMLFFLLAWHSRGRGFDSLQLHHEACQGVTEKSVTPFSFEKSTSANTHVGYGVGPRHRIPI